MKLTFPEAITTNMKIGNAFIVFKCPAICKQSFQIFIIFIEINVNVCLLGAHPVIKSIILHTRSLNSQKMSVTHLVFMFLLIFFFSHFKELKSTFLTSFHFAP